jgi:hypothetical protein
MYAEDEAEAPVEAPGQSPKPGEEDGQDDASTFLIPKDAHPDAKPGDTITLKVVRAHDEELECAVVEAGPEDEAKPDMGGMEDGEVPQGEDAEAGGGMY